MKKKKKKKTQLFVYLFEPRSNLKDDCLVSLSCPIWGVLQSGNAADCKGLILISWILRTGEEGVGR